MQATVQALLATPLSEHLSPAEAAELAQAGAVRTVPRGSTLARAGEKGDALYVILNGSLQVMLGTPPGTPVATLSAGQIAGELEVMTRSLRVASLAALEETEVFEIQATQLERLLTANRPAANKLVLLIARTLARRLAAVNQRLIDRAPPPPPAEEEAVVVAETDLVPVVDDEDLAVLDKIWGA